jgi:CheY-like chemotaxis protein
MTPHTVTIVDSSPGSAARAERLLRKAGHQVRVAPDVAALARQFREDGPTGLILVARRLASMDALQLTRVLKANAWLRHIPVVLMGEGLTPAQIEEALACGCAGVVDGRLRAHQVPALATAA